MNNSIYFLQVRLISSWQEPLWYSCFSEGDVEKLKKQNLKIVLVPFKTKLLFAVVLQITQIRPVIVRFGKKSLVKIRSVQRVFDTLFSEQMNKFINKLAGFYGIDVQPILEKTLSLLAPLDLEPAACKALNDNVSEPSAISLTVDQEHVFNQMSLLLDEQKFNSALLFGVTASGKSEIYLSLILKALSAESGSAIFLAPEVSLAINFTNFFKQRLQGYGFKIFGLHSATTKQEEIELYQACLAGGNVLLIGVHLPIYFDLPNLKLIIIDEEHEDSFTDVSQPFIDHKLASFLRAQTSESLLLLGSATPSASSWKLAKEGKIKSFSLTSRYAGAVPSFEVVKLDFEDKPFWLSHRLKLELKKRVFAGQQAILFLNRRGYSGFVQCKKCREIVFCKNCSVSLTLHKNQSGFELLCHYCDFKMSLISKCQCGGQVFVNKVLGIDQVVEKLEKLFPDFRILKADQAASKRKDWGQKLLDFAQGKFDILVGTKTITKGYHFPKVSMVASLWADLDFSFPDYTSRERAYQQLLQLAGRSGRGAFAESGLVLIQAFNPNILPEKLGEEFYPQFLEEELLSRQMFGYPPYSKLAEITVWRDSEDDAIQDASKIKVLLAKNIDQKDFMVLGPALPPIFKIRNQFGRTLMFKIYNQDALAIFVKNLKLVRDQFAPSVKIFA